MPRYFRYLRIAFSAGCGLACVLLVVLWVRSYWWMDSIVHENGHDSMTLATEPGGVVFENETYPALEVHDAWSTISERLPASTPPSALPQRAFAWQNHTNWSSLLIPYWCPALVAGLIGIAPWVRWSRAYSLRAFLMFATLVAVVIGLIARPH